MFFTGIDQHRRSSVLTTLTAQGERLEQVTLPNDRSLLAHYFAQFPGPHHAVVEATGRWYWLRDLLQPQGIDLHLAHAKFLKAIAYAKVKTDAVDSATLAQLLRTGLIPEAHMIADAQRGPRDVLRARLRLVERRSRCKSPPLPLAFIELVLDPRQPSRTGRLFHDLMLPRGLILQRYSNRNPEACRFGRTVPHAQESH